MVKFKSSKIEARGGGTFDLFNKTKLSAQGKKLLKEWKKIDSLSNNSDVITYIIRKRNRENLPVEYEIIYKIRSIIGIEENGEDKTPENSVTEKIYHKPLFGNEHRLSIILPNNYPSAMGGNPEFKMISDTWHPNIRATGKFKGRICLNDKDLGISVGLDERILRVGKYLQYQMYWATDSYPWPEDKVVAEWVREEAEPMGWVNLKEGIFTDTSTLFVKPKKEEPSGTKEQTEPKEDKIQKIKLTLAKLEKEVSKLTTSEEVKEDTVTKKELKVDSPNFEKKEELKGKREKVRIKPLIKIKKETDKKTEPADVQISEVEKVVAKPSEPVGELSSDEAIKKEIEIQDIPVKEELHLVEDEGELSELEKSEEIDNEKVEVKDKESQIQKTKVFASEKKELVLDDVDDDEPDVDYPEIHEAGLINVGIEKALRDSRDKTLPKRDEIIAEEVIAEDSVKTEDVPVESKRKELVLDDDEPDVDYPEIHEAGLINVGAEKPLRDSGEKKEPEKDEISYEDLTRDDSVKSEEVPDDLKEKELVLDEEEIETVQQVVDQKEIVQEDKDSSEILADSDNKKVSVTTKVVQEVVDNLELETEKDTELQLEKEESIIENREEILEKENETSIDDSDEIKSDKEYKTESELSVEEPNKSEKFVAEKAGLISHKKEEVQPKIQDDSKINLKEGESGKIISVESLGTVSEDEVNEIEKTEIKGTEKEKTVFDKVEAEETLVTEAHKEDEKTDELEKVAASVIPEPEVKDTESSESEKIEPEKAEFFYNKIEEEETTLAEAVKEDDKTDELDKVEASVISEPEVKEAEPSKSEIIEAEKVESFYDKVGDEEATVIEATKEDKEVDELKKVEASVISEPEVKEAEPSESEKIEAEKVESFYDKAEDEEATVIAAPKEDEKIDELKKVEASVISEPEVKEAEQSDSETIEPEKADSFYDKVDDEVTIISETHTEDEKTDELEKVTASVISEPDVKGTEPSEAETIEPEKSESFYDKVEDEETIATEVHKEDEKTDEIEKVDVAASVISEPEIKETEPSELKTSESSKAESFYDKVEDEEATVIAAPKEDEKTDELEKVEASVISESDVVEKSDASIKKKIISRKKKKIIFR